MTNHNVFADPQATMGFLLKPPDQFQTLYQGLARSTPLPLVGARYQQGVPKYDRLDPNAAQGATDISQFFSRYIPSPIGATMMILLPRARYFDDTPQETTYNYELRWRLRTVTDHSQLLEGKGDPAMPYQLIPERGAPDGSTPLTQIPAWTSEVIELGSTEAVGNGLLPVISAPTQRGYAGQGLYVPDSVGGVGNAYAPNNFFRLFRRVEGNELSIVCYRPDDEGAATWDFANDDAGIANVYGARSAGDGQHQAFPGVGAYVVFLAASPAL